MKSENVSCRLLIRYYEINNVDVFFHIPEYLSKYNYNVFAVDWSILCPGPCYPTAVYNTRHVGKCMAQLVNRIRESGADDIHIVGFSLGAHVANYLANNLRPYKLPRISGKRHTKLVRSFFFKFITFRIRSCDARFYICHQRK